MTKISTLVTFSIFMICLLLSTSIATAKKDCDRACLEGFVTAYLEALLARDPATAPLSQRARYTENGQRLAVGDGLWATVTELGRYRNVFADTETGQAAVITTLKEGDSHDILAARLKVERGKIAEIEVIVDRPSGSSFMAIGGKMFEEIGNPDPLWSDAIPFEERMTRKDLQRVANMYFAGLEKNDGKGEYPFTDDCVRIENGMKTTNVTPPPGERAMGVTQLGCKAQFETGYFRFVDRIRDRRFPLIDVERGVVFAFAFFDHSGTMPEVTLTSGERVAINLTTPFTWEIAEAFKIEKGLLRRIEAMMTRSPYGMKPGW